MKSFSHVLGGLLCMLCSFSVHAAGGFSISEVVGKHIDVSYADRVVLRLMTANDASTPETALETYKVYAHVMDPLDPDNQRTLTKGAGFKFPHHRGLFIGWSKTKIEGLGQFDTWHMKDGVRQEYQRIVSQETNPDHASLTVAIHWLKNDQVLLQEERTLYVTQPEPNGALQVNMTSRLTAVAGATDLQGDPEHAGCHFRANEQVVDNKSAKYLMPEGRDVKELDLPWTAMTFKLGDQAYHVQHMSHPALPKGNRYSAYRDYGRFGAFWTDHLEKGAPAEFRIGFYISPGGFPEGAQEIMTRRYQAFAK